MASWNTVNSGAGNILSLFDNQTVKNKVQWNFDQNNVIFYKEITFKIVCKMSAVLLTHLPLVPHICVSELVSIGSDNGLSPVRHKAIV